MVAAGEDRRDVDAAERRRAGVLRVLEPAVGERLLLGRGFVDRARQQPDHRVDDDERRQLAAGEDVVADRQLEVDERADPLVDALVARAQTRTRCERVGEVAGPLLAEDLAGRVEQDDARLGPAQRVERRGDRLRPQDHPRAAAVRRVVDAPVPPHPPLAAGRGSGS